MKDQYDGHWWEAYLTQDEWGRMPESRRMWHCPDSSEEIEGRLQTEHEMGLVAVDLLLVLTPRQREVVELYCLVGQTQVEVAAALGITQQSVQQHLMGKLRNGHHVGGAFRKLRKTIRKAAKARAGQENRRARIISVFNELLDSEITRRRARGLIGALVRDTRFEFPKENEK